MIWSDGRGRTAVWTLPCATLEDISITTDPVGLGVGWIDRASTDRLLTIQMVLIRAAITVQQPSSGTQRVTSQVKSSRKKDAFRFIEGYGSFSYTSHLIRSLGWSPIPQHNRKTFKS